MGRISETYEQYKNAKIFEKIIQQGKGKEVGPEANDWIRYRM